MASLLAVSLRVCRKGFRASANQILATASSERMLVLVATIAPSMVASSPELSGWHRRPKGIAVFAVDRWSERDDGLSFSWPPVGDGQDSWRLIEGNAAYRRDYDASGRYRVGDA